MKAMLTVFAMALVTATSAQVTIENLLSAPFPSHLISSRDGKRIAWVFNDEGKRNIWIAESPLFEAKKITPYDMDDGQEITSLIFNFAATKLYFVRGGPPNSQGELPNPAAIQEPVERALWSVTLEGKLQKLATGYYPRLSPDGKTIAFLAGGQVFIIPEDGSAPGEKLFISRGNQHSLRWSPDGKKIAFISSRGDHSFLGIFDLDKRRLEFPDPSIDHDDDPVWSPDGKYLAYLRMPNVKNRLPFIPEREGSPWSIRVVNVETGVAREVWKALPGRGSVLHDGIPAIDNRLFWAHDQILFPWERDGWVHYYSVSQAGGEPVLLTPGDGEIEQASMSADRESLIYSANIGDLERRHIFTASIKTRTVTPISQGKGIEWNAIETSAGFICLRSDAISPAWIWSISSKGEPRMLAREVFPSSFPGNQLITPQAITIDAPDGMKIPCQLFLPPTQREGQKRPAVIFFHGGPRRQMLLGFNYGQYYHHAYALNQYLASKGYIVLSVNFRSGIGYGLDFREATAYGAAGASEFNDVRGAGEYLRERKDVDADKIGLWGGSYGGYLTALGLSRAPELFACGVDIHGVHDWNVVIKNFVPGYDAGKLPDIAKRAFDASPMSFVDRWKAPVLLIHGDDDRNVPFSETVNMAESLRAQRVYFEQLILVDEVHSFLRHENWLRAYKACADFFDRQFSKKKLSE
jgi:dipeptidyl aminopeptidase/acylaminoacyl peptidase